MAAPPIRIGTRGSQLARWQANWVASALTAADPNRTAELVIIKTKGDKILDVPLARVGGKGLFVKEIEAAVSDGRADLAVHSMKDMPADLPEGLIIGAVPKRESAGDVLISRTGAGLADLPPGAVVGTSSLRRAAQIRHRRPDLTVIPIRGNLDTRLKKLDAGEVDATVLAAAGVRRLGMEARITEHLDEETMLPAVGQGALCVEIRRDDPEIGPLAAALDHADSRLAVTAERAFLHRLEGSCQVPVAGRARINGDTLTLTGLVAELDGSTVFKDVETGPADTAEALGRRLADRLIERGAGDVLARLKASAHDI